MNYEELKKLISDNSDKVDFAPFGNGVDEEWIKLAEKRLMIHFPESYKWWLKNYGGGEINGEEVFSIYEIDFDQVVGGDIVYINERNRAKGFIKEDELSIHENDQGEIYYFKLIENEGEFAVYVKPGEIKYADNFIDFLIKKIKEL